MRRIARNALPGALALLLGLLGTVRATANDDAERFFEERVRPVLVENCQDCHGPMKQWSGLRLDSRAAALKGGDIGPAVVPGDPASSLLLDAVTHADDFLKMPPKRDKLPDHVIADLRAWVEMGAPWPEPATPTADATADPRATHWAFQPIRTPDVPAVRDSSWVVNPVDAFVLARLEAAGLTPSPEADRRTLIRRVTFDLTGLPPTPGEVEAFLNDKDPDAYARLVDRLLASPAYGERWGRHWLDVARYADTKGYVFQDERRYPYAYTYRDYVIQSFNDDKPFDQFLIEQLAADLLPEADSPAGRERLAGLGFLTVGRRFLNRQDDIIDDRIDVTTRGLMGLTVSCARCHDHKFDPIPTADYYSLYGVFASSEEPEELPLLADPAEIVLPEGYRTERDKRVGEVKAYIDAKRAEFRKELHERLADALAAAVALEMNARHAKLEAVASEAKLRPELLRHLITRWKARLDATGKEDDPLLGAWHALAALPAGPEFAAKAEEIRADLKARAGDDPIRKRVFESLFPPDGGPPADLAEVARRYGALLTQVVGEPEPPVPLRALWEDPAGPLALPDQDDALTRLFNRADRNRLRELQRQVAQLDVTHPEAPPRAMVLVDKATPYEPYVFLRGNSGRRGESVPRQFLEILSGPERTPFGPGSGRLELARAIASPENPLTARVLVNRVWMQHLGRPLVSTPSDFGLRSDPPTHPELLDWLASTLIEQGWSVKSLHRLILLTSTYRQQSLNRADCQSTDPENALIWRQNRQRLELEPLRDAILAVSGRLDPTMGGRAVEITDPPFATRRTVYAFIDRQNLPGLFRTFDLASPDSSSPQRYETTVPQQALFLMNSPFLAEQARHLAARLDAAGAGSPEARVQQLHSWLYGRPAESHEVEAALRFVASRETVGDPGAEIGWKYGYGRFDEAEGRVSAFTEYPHWTGEAWQFGPKLPHPEFGYLHQRADSAHVGNGPDQAAILRWVAPHDAVIGITGTLGHKNEKGDGVRARIVAGQGGLLGEWVAANTTAPTAVERYEVKAGETIDFVVDCRAETSYDSYTWAPAVRLLENPDGLPVTTWNARDDFQGPQPPPLMPWEQYAQVLLLTNEFAYID